MVILKNIQRTNEYISAAYYPEGKEPEGFMKISLLDKEVMEHKNVNSLVAVHVRSELRRLAKIENPPEEKIVLWY